MIPLARSQPDRSKEASRRRRLLFASAVGVAILVLGIVSCRRPQVREKTLRPWPRVASMPAPAAPASAIITGLRAPESVLYDPDQDVYFISNINGGLLTVDGNGFLSRVNPDTLAVELKWVEGGRNGVTLDAPKGMTLVGDTLYVADVGAVRRFDRRTGAPRGSIALPHSTLINDLTNDGTNVYVSDTGVMPGPGITFVPTGTDAVWKISGDTATRIASGPELHQPNGVDWVNGSLRLASFEGNAIQELGADGHVRSIAELPDGQLDGLLHLADGSVIVTSWLGKAVYRGRPGGAFATILAGVAAPADIGYDTKRKRLLLPSSPANQVTIHDLR